MLMAAGFLPLGLDRAESQGAAVFGFSQLGKPLPDLKAGEAEALVLYAAGRLKGETASAVFPARLKKDADPRICFITLADGQGERKVAAGTGQGIARALDQALQEMMAIGEWVLTPAAGGRVKAVTYGGLSFDLGPPLRLEVIMDV